MATGKKRKRSAQKALVLDNAAVAGSSDESATKKPRQASSLEASSNTTRAPLVAESGVSSVAADADPNSKAARRRKKKLRERNKKTRLREKAGASTGVDRSLNSESRKHVSAPADQEGQPKLSKRMKKRANWLAKHPNSEAKKKNAPAPAKSAREGKGSTSGREKVDGIRPQKSTLSKRGRVKSSKPLIDDGDLSDVDLPYKPIGASSYDDYEQEPEETYLGKRARKSSGGGKLGKGRKASRGGSVHHSKKERKEKRDAKDATNADKVGKKQRGSKKDGKGGKGKGKGKGKRKGNVAVGTRKERKHKGKGRGKGKGGK